MPNVNTSTIDPIASLPPGYTLDTSPDPAASMPLGGVIDGAHTRRPNC